MQIFHLIYTKVAPEDSPWKKADFHTVFYPIELITKTSDLFEIEKKVYFPGSGRFTEKQAIFYQKMQDKYYLVILHTQDLPEEKDTFGRAGIFLCHGFIFPEELWMRVPTPLTLFELVKDKIFRDRNAMLSSPLIDRQTGNTRPIEIPEERLKEISTNLPNLHTEFEWRMAILLNRFSQVTSKPRPAILIKGEPEKISMLMNNLIAYVPCELKVNIGWDDCFDAGNLTFPPLKILGFRYERPRGGIPLEIDIDASIIHETEETTEFLLPERPYENWLNYCRNKEANSYEQIEMAYNLSLLLEKGVSFTTNKILTERRGFVLANREIIEDIFLRRASQILGEEMSRRIISILTQETMLDIIIENFHPARVIQCIEDVILKDKLTPTTLKRPIPETFIKAGSYRLKLIERVWKGKPLVPQDLALLDKTKRFEIINYLILTEWKNKDWLLEILKEDEEIFESLLSSHETRRVIEDLLLEGILAEKGFSEIEEIILSEVLRQKKGFTLLRKEINLVDLLEGFLKDLTWDDNQIRMLILWAKKKKHPEEKLPYIRAFLYPGYGIPDEVLRESRIRERLIKVLIQHHGYKVEDLKKLNLTENELSRLKEQIEEKRLVKRIKGFFKKMDLREGNLRKKEGGE